METIENQKIKRSNTSAIIGFLLTLLNLVISSALLITDSAVALLIFTSVTAALSLILCGAGLSRSKTVVSGKVISVIGIVINVLILSAVLIGLLILILFFRSSSNTGM